MPRERQIVYAVTNKESFRSLWVKIGRTGRRDPNVRVAELSRTSVPHPFYLDLAYEVADSFAAEAALHDMFGARRVRPDREFFDVGINEVEGAMRHLGGRDVTLEAYHDHSIIGHDEDIDYSKPPMKLVAAETLDVSPVETVIPTYPGNDAQFLYMGLKVEDEIVCVLNGEVASILNNRKIRFRGERMSLNHATTLIDGRPRAGGFDHYDLWTHDGMTLMSIWREWRDGGRLRRDLMR